MLPRGTGPRYDEGAPGDVLKGGCAVGIVGGIPTFCNGTGAGDCCLLAPGRTKLASPEPMPANADAIRPLGAAGEEDLWRTS